ncbi:MAG: elongation factor G [bacterium]|nr:elongation factor G [bacterium]
MKVYETANIRNLALIGHGDSGKTSLTAALLHTSGAVTRLGKVDDGTATTDYDEEEVERKISLQAGLAHMEWKSKKINVVDTPGYAAFLADAQSALAAVDSAAMLIDGVAGVEVITRRVFRFAEHYELPLMFVVNKLDRERSSYARCVEAIQERFGRTAVPVQLAIGEEDQFSGVVDLLTMKAHTYERDGNGKYKAGDVPDDMKDAAETAHAALVEMVAETDDALMEKFFEEGNLAPEELTQGLRKAVLGRQVFPIFAASALHAVGTQGLLDFAADVLPAPNDRPPTKMQNPADDSEIERPVADGEPTALFVFKTLADAFAGHLSVYRVCSGMVKNDTHVNNVRTGHSERLGHPSLLQGQQLVQVDQIHAGDLGVAAKLKETKTNDTLADPSSQVAFPPVEFPEPVISYAIEPSSKGDEEKINSSLQRLCEEDPVLRVGRDATTGEMLVSGSGQIHVEVALSKMKRKFGVEAILHPPKVPYLETIKKKVENVEGKHKKQSGGRGQFGVCVIHMEPGERGTGFVFVDKIFGGSIPQNYRPAVEKGIRETSERGWQVPGCPVIDFQVTLIDGKYHNVDSSEMAFKIAGSLAFKAAMEQAAPTLLEPIMSVEISSPEEYMGDIMADLSSRRGKPQGMDADGDHQVIRAQVPMAEMLNYATTLKSITSDRATYHMEFDHYHEAPAQVRKEIVAEAQKAQATES